MALALGAPGLKDPAAKANPLIGEWTLESTAVSGRVQRAIEDMRDEFTADGKWLRYRSGKKVMSDGQYTLHPKIDERAIDLKVRIDNRDFPEIQAIFKVEGDTLTICLAQDGRTVRPTDFEIPKDNQTGLFVFKRVKKKD